MAASNCRLRIMVVDDEPDMAATFRELLAGDGDHVEIAKNGSEEKSTGNRFYHYYRVWYNQ
jgi:CheY-like chemotaxis protein